MSVHALRHDMTGQVGGFQNPGVCLQAFPYLSSLPKYALEISELLLLSSRDFEFSDENSLTPLLYFVRNRFQSVQDCCFVLY